MSKILLVTGEASGDIHGAHLAEALRELDPGVKLYGVGGQRMAEKGVNLVPGVARVDAIGVPGIRQLFQGWRTLRFLSRYVQREKFSAIVLIDSPGLNLRLAKAAVKAKQHIIYYIAPQIWAWGRRRLKLICRVIDHVLVVLPFEQSLYQNAGVPCTYVGHPLLDEIQTSYDQVQEREALGLPARGVVVGLLPGSREREVRDFLPVLLEAVQEVSNTFPSLQIVLAQAGSVPSELIQDLLRSFEGHVHVVLGKANEVIASADILLVASGTATLQAALIGTPMVIVYRTSRITYEFAKRLIKIPYIGLVNILAGHEVVPELIQAHMTSSAIAKTTLEILQDPARQESMKSEFRSIAEKLGDSGASRRAARSILAEMRS